MDEPTHTPDAVFEDALAALGAGPSALSADAARSLDDAGYVLFRAAVDPAWLSALREDCDGARHDEGRMGQGGNQQLGCVGTRRGALRAIQWPRLLAAVWHVLRRPFVLGSVAWRNPRHGLGQQGLHADWSGRGDPGAYHVVTALWYLDDLGPDNGPTRVVPGTHKLRRSPPKSFADPASHHPQEMAIQAEAGSVLVFNGHLWHSGTRNRSGAPRRTLQCCFIGREHRDTSPAAVDDANGLSPAARLVLGATESAGWRSLG
ncbi:phytanoyl-CoA dioxygenase family protein [Sorangium sp. So ce1036]|uniref:phytanoyl-CoA dioxygenase family protein n=1 Tax=Sorangium sp. So ce1036 TaxID=3133328 RepID=UPI003F025298